MCDVVSHFVSRLGNKFEAPDWFLEGLPSSSMPLDGELWKGRGMFQSAVGIVKSKGKTDKWKELTYQGTFASFFIYCPIAHVSHAHAHMSPHTPSHTLSYTLSVRRTGHADRTVRGADGGHQAVVRQEG